jgi:hypothetical protein
VTWEEPCLGQVKGGGCASLRPACAPSTLRFGANTREKLKEYDPDLFALVDEVYKQSKFRYVRYDKRK